MSLFEYHTPVVVVVVVLGVVVVVVVVVVAEVGVRDDVCHHKAEFINRVRLG